MKTNGAILLLALSGIVAIAAAFSASNADYIGADVLVSLSTGYTISVMFFFMLIWYPERAKRRRIKKNLIQNYHEFKAEILGLLLHAAGKGYSIDERDELLDPKEFTRYFSEDETGSGMRWYEVMNGLDDYYVSEIALRLELLRTEVHFTLESLEITDDDLFLFMKRLSQISRRMMSVKADYDDVKLWGRFLWNFFSDWDPAVGQQDGDQNLKMLERI